MQSPRAVPNTVRARRARPPLPRWVIGVMVLCTVIEAAFWLAPLVGLGGLRRAADVLGVEDGVVARVGDALLEQRVPGEEEGGDGQRHATEERHRTEEEGDPRAETE